MIFTLNGFFGLVSILSLKIDCLKKFSVFLFYFPTNSRRFRRKSEAYGFTVAKYKNAHLSQAMVLGLKFQWQFRRSIIVHEFLIINYSLQMSQPHSLIYYTSHPNFYLSKYVQIFTWVENYRSFILIFLLFFKEQEIKILKKQFCIVE